jgi:hypothetical protein
MGNHRRFVGDALVQKVAMAKLDLRLASMMTYSSFRPMMPLSIISSPLYLIGFITQVAYWLKERVKGVKQKITRTDLPGGYYLSNGWEKQFLERTIKKYGLSVKSTS